MAEPAKDVMVKDATPKKAMFVNRPYSQEERLKKDEEELARLVEEQKVQMRLARRKRKVKQSRLLLKKKLSRSDMEIYADIPKKKNSNFKSS